MLVVLLGGIFCFGNLLRFIVTNSRGFSFKKYEYKHRPFIVFLLSFICFLTVNLTVLFLCYYPGMVTADSVRQIRQILSGAYTNHHPFYHTMLIKFLLTIGGNLFGDINAAIAVYSIFQIIFMALCFSYLIVTLYQMKISSKLIAVCLCFYLFMPYHIMYSFTMWKDVLFGGFILLFIISLYRLLKMPSENITINYILVFVSSMGMCLFRSNGWFAFLLTFIIFIYLFRLKYKKLLFMFSFVIIFTFVLKHNVLNNLNVKQPDIIESLSIPAQQFARVVTDCKNLTAKQRDLLEQIVSVDDIPKVYLDYISDPVKELVRKKKRQDYLEENKSAYLKLYLELFLKHPDKYFEAWIDETKGYWNGGYPYWRWSKKMKENDLGIKRTVNSTQFNSFFDKYLYIYEAFPLLQLFLSIGLFVWLLIGLFFINIIKHNKTTLFLTIPEISVILSLLIATPVFSEFRYAYTIFCCVPFIFFITFSDKSTENTDNITV